MKRVCALFLVILMTVIITACGTAAASSDISSEPIVSSIASTAFLDPSSNVSTTSVDLSQPLITITSGGKTISTYESILSDFSWDGENFRCADCASVWTMLPEIANELSVITYDDNFTIQYREDASFMYIAIYNDDFERLYNAVDLSYLKKLPEGTYYIAIDVRKQGRYIISEDQYEVSGIECAFELVIE